MLVDAETFPRDKPCGDGLTPRAIAELHELGLGQWLEGRARNWGLRAAGFGQELYLPWPGGSLPRYGGAVPRLELDATIRQVALDAGVRAVEGHRAVDVRIETRPGARGRLRGGSRTRPGRDHLPSARRGRRRAVAARPHARPHVAPQHRLRRRRPRLHQAPVAATTRGSRRTWSSAASEDEMLSGYGWVFPLGDGEVNVGVGTLATDEAPRRREPARPARRTTPTPQREAWQFEGDVRAPWSALLPMGGAVSGVAGPNWLLVGDAAGCVNPLNGEGIDYGLETGHLAARLLADTIPNPALDYTAQWAPLLRSPLRLGVLDRPAPRRPADGAGPAAHAGTGGHALADADDRRASRHGQPRDAGGQRHGGAAVAGGRAHEPALGRPPAVQLRPRGPWPVPVAGHPWRRRARRASRARAGRPAGRTTPARPSASGRRRPRPGCRGPCAGAAAAGSSRGRPGG